MEIQTFKIMRTGSARITARSLRDLLKTSRPDTDWTVREIVKYGIVKDGEGIKGIFGERFQTPPYHISK